MHHTPHLRYSLERRQPVHVSHNIGIIYQFHQPVCLSDSWLCYTVHNKRLLRPAGRSSTMSTAITILAIALHLAGSSILALSLTMFSIIVTKPISTPNPNLTSLRTCDGCDSLSDRATSCAGCYLLHRSHNIGWHWYVHSRRWRAAAGTEPRS